MLLAGPAPLHNIKVIQQAAVSALPAGLLPLRRQELCTSPPAPLDRQGQGCAIWCPCHQLAPQPHLPAPHRQLYRGHQTTSPRLLDAAVAHRVPSMFTQPQAILPSVSVRGLSQPRFLGSFAGGCDEVPMDL